MQINRKSFGTLKSDRYGRVTVMDEWPLRQVLLYLVSCIMLYFDHDNRYQSTLGADHILYIILLSTPFQSFIQILKKKNCSNVSCVENKRFCIVSYFSFAGEPCFHCPLLRRDAGGHRRRYTSDEEEPSQV